MQVLRNVTYYSILTQVVPKLYPFCTLIVPKVYLVKRIPDLNLRTDDLIYRKISETTVQNLIWEVIVTK